MSSPCRRVTLLTVAAVLAAFTLVGCTTIAPAQPTPTLTARERKQLPTPTPLPRPVDGADAVPPRQSVFLDGVKVPVSLIFAPDGRLFFNEVFDGKVRIAERTGDQARLIPDPFVRLETARGAEAGVLGVTLDPDYERNRWVYVYYSEPDPNRRDRVPLRNRVVRFTDQGNVGAEMTVIFDDIPMAREGRHNGGRLAFGPDGKLYVATGNAQDRKKSQDMTSTAGKLLRINPDGTIPADNPFPGSPIYALGFRNLFGLTFQPGTGAIYVTENSGDSEDEVNVVQAGGNYGFPSYEGPGNDPTFIDPIWSSGPQTIGPTGLTFYSGDQLPQFRGDLFFCAVNTGSLTRLRLSSEADRVVAAEDVAQNCHLDVVNGPDGALYYASMSQILRLGR